MSQSSHIPNPKRKGLLKGDRILFISISLMIIAGLGFHFYLQAKPPTPNAYVQVESFGTGAKSVYPLYTGQNESFQFEGPVGKTTLLLQDGKAIISHSDCPDQLCVHVFGWLEKPPQMSVCLPNEIMVQIVDSQ
ncbi:MAG: NusG domain II-containing protein [Firmicutes bacterium]|nr:NusG domain II-containing protein [Bacillota bacterium]